MRTSTPSYIVELPLRANDQQDRFLNKAFEFGRTLYNATLGTALVRLQSMRKHDHGELANKLLQIGGRINIEKNSYLSFQRNFGKSTTKAGTGMFFEHLKRKAVSAGGKVNELNAYLLKMSQYDPPTNTYTKKLLKVRWHRYTLVQRDVMSAFLACYATEKGHDQALLLRKWTTA